MAQLEYSVDATKFGALDAGLKGLYSQQGDKYVLNVDQTPAMAALEAERQAKKALEAKLAGYGELTPEQAKALADAKSKAEREKDFASGNFEKILAETNAKHAKDLELAADAKKQLEATLKTALIDAEATRALVAEGGNPDLLLPIIQSRAKLEAAGDKLVAVVIGDKGGPLLKAGAQKADDYMPISEYVATLKSDKRYAGAFASPAGSGSGGSRNGAQRPSSQGAARAATVDRLAKAIADGASSLSE